MLPADKFNWPLHCHLYPWNYRLTLSYNSLLTPKQVFKFTSMEIISFEEDLILRFSFLKISDQYAFSKCSEPHCCPLKIYNFFDNFFKASVNWPTTWKTKLRIVTGGIAKFYVCIRNS